MLPYERAVDVCVLQLSRLIVRIPTIFSGYTKPEESFMALLELPR